MGKYGYKDREGRYHCGFAGCSHHGPRSWSGIKKHFLEKHGNLDAKVPTPPPSPVTLETPGNPGFLAKPSRPQVVPTGETSPFTCGRCGQVVHAWMTSRGLPLAVSYCEKCLSEDEFESMDDWIGAVVEGASHPGPITTPSDPKDLRIKLPRSKKSLLKTRIKLRRR